MVFSTCYNILDGTTFWLQRDGWRLYLPTPHPEALKLWSRSGETPTILNYSTIAKRTRLDNIFVRNNNDHEHQVQVSVWPAIALQ